MSFSHTERRAHGGAGGETQHGGGGRNRQLLQLRARTVQRIGTSLPSGAGNVSIMEDREPVIAALNHMAWQTMDWHHETVRLPGLGSAPAAMKVWGVEPDFHLHAINDWLGDALGRAGNLSQRSRSFEHNFRARLQVASGMGDSSHDHQFKWIGHVGLGIINVRPVGAHVAGSAQGQATGSMQRQLNQNYQRTDTSTHTFGGTANASVRDGVGNNDIGTQGTAGGGVSYQYQNQASAQNSHGAAETATAGTTTAHNVATEEQQFEADVVADLSLELRCEDFEDFQPQRRHEQGPIHCGTVRYVETTGLRDAR